MPKGKKNKKKQNNAQNAEKPQTQTTDGKTEVKTSAAETAQITSPKSSVNQDAVTAQNQTSKTAHSVETIPKSAPSSKQKVQVPKKYAPPLESPSHKEASQPQTAPQVQASPKRAVNNSDNNNVPTPTMEQLSLKSSRKARDSNDLEVRGVATRPLDSKEPKTGVPVQLFVNHYAFMVTKRTFYQYNVDFNPEVANKSFKQKMLLKLKTKLGPLDNFDGKILFLLEQVPSFSESVLVSTKQGQRKYEIIITFTNEIKPGDRIPHQLVNLKFHNILRNQFNLKQVGRNYFDPSRRILVPQHNVELWPGYFTSISPTELGTVIVADMSHKIIRTDTVLEFINNIKKSNVKNWKELATEQLKGQIALTRYNNKTYRIDGIDWDKTPMHTFETREGKCTYSDYYAESYNKVITDKQQPLLYHKRSKNSALIYLIPEFCSMSGLSKDMRSNRKVMTDLSKHSTPSPTDRVTGINKLISDIKNHPTALQDLKTWGMDLEPKMISVTGRQLPPLEIVFRNTVMKIDNQGTWAQNAEVVSAVNLTHWVLLYPKEKCSREAETFLQFFQRESSKIGIKVANPVRIALMNDKPSSYVEEVEKHLNNNKDTQLIVFIVTSQKGPGYEQMKQYLCNVQGIQSQCVLLKTLQRANAVGSICANIARQINSKLGGEVSRVRIPLSKTMIIGIDVYHDTLTKGQSVAGFCATQNEHYTKYCSVVSWQNTGQELVDGLSNSMRIALQHYFKANKYLPTNIIVYRDGVGDGMLQGVVDHEIPQLEAACKAFDVAYTPKITFIVVKKRIHTRLVKSIGGGAFENPRPGTVVDQGCVNKDWYDFFLVPQYVRTGTVTPTHFHVVKDTTGLKPDIIQQLSFRLCHLYANWNGPIRVPAPCQYAHKIAFLAGKSLHAPPSEKLLDFLFFL